MADLRETEIEAVELARKIAAELKVCIHFGKIAHSDRVLGSPEEKASLGAQERASGVDMETATLRSWAKKSGVPVLALRAVLDAVDEHLPASAPGDEELACLAGYAFRHPGQIPLMVRTGLRHRRVMPTLALFLERFLDEL